MKTKTTGVFPKADPLTGMRAMKTIRVLITDANGTLLDRADIDIAADCARIEIQALEGTSAERPFSTVLTVGLGT